LPAANGCYGFGEGTFASTHGNGQDAPIPAVRGAAIEPLQSTLCGHSRRNTAVSNPLNFHTPARV
jgi:hypothetical protein